MQFNLQLIFRKKAAGLGCKHILLLSLCCCVFGAAYSQDVPADAPTPPVLQKPLDTLPLQPPDSTIPVIKKPSILLKIVNTIVFGVKIGPGRLLSLPVITYAPETSLGLGATFMYVFRFDKKDSSGTNVSYVNSDVLITLRGQVVIEQKWNFIIKKGLYRTAGNASFRIYPDYYYGLGNSINNNKKQQYQANYGFLKAHFTPRVGKNLYMGGQYSFEDLYFIKPSQPARWDSAHVPGAKGYLASGFGFRGDYDTRDNNYYPFKGTYISLGNVFYSKAFGSNQYFNNVTLNIRQFFNPWRAHVIAMQGYLEFNPGFYGNSPPFRMLATFGGLEMMRGYYRWQYRDKNAMVFQLEYRFPIFWRFMGVAFGSTGDVFDKGSDLRWSRLKVAGGAGLRFTLDAKERVNIRVDCAWGRFNNTKMPGIYFALGESF